MSADGMQFVDTNVLVYAHDSSAGVKRGQAVALLADLWASGHGCVSIQVLQELYVTLTSKVKNPISPKSAREMIAAYGEWRTYSPVPRDVLAAIDIQRAHGISFWDAMILRSAEASGCATLWSEDLQHGRSYGAVRVQNPFAAAP